MMSSDVFLRILAPTRPSVSIVDKDLFGSDVGLYRECTGIFRSIGLHDR